MKIFKKILGVILMIPFIAMGVIALYYNITEVGWYFILAMVGMIAILALFILGAKLFSGK